MRGLEVETDGDGNPTAQAEQYDIANLTNEEQDGLASGDLRIADLAGGIDPESFNG